MKKIFLMLRRYENPVTSGGSGELPEPPLIFLVKHHFAKRIGRPISGQTTDTISHMTSIRTTLVMIP